MADWIQVKLHERGMAPHQLGEKMGIAAAVVKAWKGGRTRPTNRQMREMVSLLGAYRQAPQRLERALLRLKATGRHLPQSPLGTAMDYALGQWTSLQCS